MDPKYLVMFRRKTSGEEAEGEWHAHRLFSTFEDARANRDLLAWYDTLEARVCELSVAQVTGYEIKLDSRPFREGEGVITRVGTIGSGGIHWVKPS